METLSVDAEDINTIIHLSINDKNVTGHKREIKRVDIENMINVLRKTA